MLIGAAESSAGTAGRDLVNPLLLRSYDLRGAIGSELTERDAYALGLSYAGAVARRKIARVAVGYDGRLSSPALEAALTRGLVDGGVEVLRIGLCPTGMLYFAVHERDLDGGIMVTGSHNPPDQNGFKLLIGREPVYGATLSELIGRPGSIRHGGRIGWIELESGYVARLAGAAAGVSPLNIAWDAGSGAAGAVVERLSKKLPGVHDLLNCTIDGRFPAHHPDPSVPENLASLRKVVLERGLDLGIAFDGDGDRIGVVDDEGEIVCADQLLLFLARDVLAKHPGAPIVGDVKSSRILFDGIAAAGGQPRLSRSGYVLVREAMIAAGAPLAGEMSGHIFYADLWNGTDDAIHVAMRLLGALGRSGQSLATFRARLPRTHATPEIRMPCPDEAKAAILARVGDRLEREGAKVDRTDGLRVSVADGWWLVRSSGTEPKLTARIEACSESALSRLKAELFSRLAEAGLTPS